MLSLLLWDFIFFFFRARYNWWPCLRRDWCSDINQPTVFFFFFGRDKCCAGFGNAHVIFLTNEQTAAMQIIILLAPRPRRHMLNNRKRLFVTTRSQCDCKIISAKRQAVLSTNARRRSFVRNALFYISKPLLCTHKRCRASYFVVEAFNFLFCAL